ncbi:hypothetical protein KUCAC02_022632 [Chaenocephalus aceratus]|uniref:Uncharacterized protein n=1 Tax=Chaenocephalus aceratus TaxID=36190 RepID=A0ACB9XNR2_CHAAC|nr:hypothetical protein KUCAC02_022632 [Chaenocephalus aceratus]
MLAWSFSATSGGAAHYDLQTSSPHWAQMVLFTMTATLFPLTHRLHPTLLYPDVSGACPWGPVGVEDPGLYVLLSDQPFPHFGLIS